MHKIKLPITIVYIVFVNAKAPVYRCFSFNNKYFYLFACQPSTACSLFNKYII